MSIYTPYAYLVGWSKHDLWYYGSEYANNKIKVAHPANLWTKYFTSSKHVKAARDEFGEPDVVQIRKTFKTAAEARLWEARVCERLNVRDDPKWLNKHNGDGDFLSPRLGKNHTTDTKTKISNSLLGKRKTDEMRVKLSSTLTGRVRTAEQVLSYSCEWLIIHPDGSSEQITNLAAFCRKYGLGTGNMTLVAQGKYKQHKGYRCAKLS